MADIALTYLFDPLCGWCYGAAPMMRRLAAEPGLAVELSPTGLFSGHGARPMDEGFAAYAWSNDQRIAKLSGQPFSEAYRDHVLAAGGRFDSGPATLALTAVRLTAPEREWEALKALQKARYVEGGNIVTEAGAAAVLQGLGLDAAAARLAAPDGDLIAENQARMAKAGQLMAAFRVNGVPAVVVTGQGGRQLLPANALFGEPEPLIAALKAA